MENVPDENALFADQQKTISQINLGVQEYLDLESRGYSNNARLTGINFQKFGI